MAHFCSIIDQGPELGRLAFKVEQGVMPFCWSEHALARVSTVRPRPRPACIIFGGFPRQLRNRVPDLSAYATEMRIPLLRARKAKGYRTKRNLKAIVYLIAGDLLANSPI